MNPVSSDGGAQELPPPVPVTTVEAKAQAAAKAAEAQTQAATKAASQAKADAVVTEMQEQDFLDPQGKVPPDKEGPAMADLGDVDPAKVPPLTTPKAPTPIVPGAAEDQSGGPAANGEESQQPTSIIDTVTTPHAEPGHANGEPGGPGAPGVQAVKQEEDHSGVPPIAPKGAEPEELQARSTFIKEQIGKEDGLKLFGDGYDPDTFDATAKLQGLEAKGDKRDVGENRMYARLREANQLALGQEGMAELKNLVDQKVDIATPAGKTAYETAQQKIALANPAERQKFLREQINADQRLQDILGKNGINYDAVVGLSEKEIVDEINKIKALDTNTRDDRTPEQIKLQYGLQEMLGLAEGDEGKRQLQILRDSGEDLTTSQNAAKVDKAREKIEKGHGAEKVRTVRERIGNDTKLQKMMSDAGMNTDILTMEQIDGFMKHWDTIKKDNPDALTGKQKDLLQSLHELSDGVDDSIAKQDMDNIKPDDPDAGTQFAKVVKRMSQAHEHDKNWIGRLKSKFKNSVEKYTHDELKSKWLKASGLSKTIKGLEEKLKDEKDESRKNMLRENIKNQKGERGKLLKEWGRDMFAKWFVILVLFGPAAASVLIALGSAQGLKMIGKSQ